MYIYIYMYVYICLGRFRECCASCACVYIYSDKARFATAAAHANNVTGRRLGLDLQSNRRVSSIGQTLKAKPLNPKGKLGSKSLDSIAQIF